MTVDYMSTLEQVARLCHLPRRNLDNIGQQVQGIWRTLESDCKSLSYDVLCTNTQHRQHIINHLRSLVALLYELDERASAQGDVQQLRTKDKEYGGSWCRRGGQGAFMMMARKWDRIEHQVGGAGYWELAIHKDQRVEGILDDIGDLRRYALLCLSWHEAQRDDTVLARVPL